MTFIPHNVAWLQNWMGQQEKAKAEKEAEAKAQQQLQQQAATWTGAVSGLSQLGQPWIASTVTNQSIGTTASGYSFTVRASEPTGPPSFEPETLQALKAAQPRRVDQPSQRITDSLSCIVGWRAWRLWPDMDEVRQMTAPVLLRAVAYLNTYPVMEKMTAICLCAQNAVTARSIMSSGPNLTGIVTMVPMEDVPPPHVAPDWNCNCGIWAFKTLDHLMAVLGQHQYGRLPVLGTVNMWGRVIETENGFRAQYAYPKELWLVNPGMERVGKLYNVPIRTPDFLADKMELTYNKFI